MFVDISGLGIFKHNEDEEEFLYYSFVSFEVLWKKMAELSQT